MHNDSILSLVILAFLFFVLPSLFKILGKYTLSTKGPQERDEDEGEELQLPRETPRETLPESSHGETRRKHKGFRKASPVQTLPSTGAEDMAKTAAGYSVIEPGSNVRSDHQSISNKPITPGWF